MILQSALSIKAALAALKCDIFPFLHRAETGDKFSAPGPSQTSGNVRLMSAYDGRAGIGKTIAR